MAVQHSTPRGVSESEVDRSTFRSERSRRAPRRLPVESPPSEEQFHLLVEEVKEYAIVMLDPEGYVTTWNAGAARINGYGREEILGGHVSTFYLPEDVEAGLPETVLGTAAREGQWTGEGWHVRNDGSRFWGHVTVTALRDEEGRLRGFAKVTRDMTEQKRHEDELARKNALLRLMQVVAAASNDARSLDEVLRVAVDATCAHTGWPVGHAYCFREREDRLVPTGLWHTADEACYEAFKTVTARTRFARGEGLPGQVLARGEPAWIEDVLADSNFLRARLAEELGIRGAFAVPVWANGEIVAVLEFFAPEPKVPDAKLLEAMQSIGVQLGRVAEREQARVALRESEAKFRALAEESPVGILLIQDGQFKYVNKMLAQMYGYGREELLGTDHASPMLVHPDDREMVRQHVEKCLGGEEDHIRIRFRGVTKGGKTLFIDAYSTCIEYQGRPAVIGMDVNVTEWLRLQREVLSVQAEERRRLGQDLHDGVASQLAGIAMMLGVLSRRTEAKEAGLSDEIQEIQELVHESGEDTRRLSRGLAPAALTGVGLPSALERLASHTKGGRFESDADLPTLEDDAAAHLYYIAQEAMANARRYAGADEIVIRLVHEEGVLILEVEDNGRGIDASSVERQGLGLRAMRYRAELLGATFTIDSSPGTGTRVHCRLLV